MNFETIIKIIGLIAAIIGAAKIIYEITTGRKSHLREDYKFAKEFLEDLKNNPNLHPFAVEKGYHAIAGSEIIDSEEISYILLLKNPGKSLRDYILSKKYLQILEKMSTIGLILLKNITPLGLDFGENTLIFLSIWFLLY